MWSALGRGEAFEGEGEREVENMSSRREVVGWVGGDGGGDGGRIIEEGCRLVSRSISDIGNIWWDGEIGDECG